MIRLVLIIAILLVVVIIFVRQKLYRSRIEGQGELECGQTAEQFADRFAVAMGAKTELPALPPVLVQGKSAAELAEAAWLTSLEILRHQHEAVIKRREKALLRAKVVPAFVAIVIGMAFVGLKIRPALGILIWILLTLMIQIPVWTTQVVDREAAKIAIDLIKKRRLFSRIRDEEKVVSCLKGLAWKRLLPFG